jgi:hypothetical protein
MVRWMVRRSRAERDLHDELEAFLDMAAAEKMRAGTAAHEARRQAVLQLGGVEQAKERVRSGRHGAALDDLGRDVQYAFRMLVKNRGFTIVAVLMLAIGMGSSSAIFSLINAIVLRPLPVDDPQELSIAQAVKPDEVELLFSSSVVAHAARLLEGRAQLAAQSSTESVLIATRTGEAGVSSQEPARLQLVAGDFFGTLRQRAQIGRLLGPDDNRSIGQHPVVVMSDSVLEPPVLGQHGIAHVSHARRASDRHRRRARRARGEPDIRNLDGHRPGLRASARLARHTRASC